MGAGRKKAVFSNLPAWPKMLGVPGDGDASVVPATHDPEKRNPPQPCFAGQGAPQTLRIPQTLLTPHPPPSSWLSTSLVLGWRNSSVLGVPTPAVCPPPPPGHSWLADEGYEDRR